MTFMNFTSLIISCLHRTGTKLRRRVMLKRSLHLWSLWDTCTRICHNRHNPQWQWPHKSYESNDLPSRNARFEKMSPSPVISISVPQVMKLPRGQNLVTMQRAPNSNQTMQIKLPPTTDRQHWCTIRVQDDSHARKVSVRSVSAPLSLRARGLKAWIKSRQ